MHSTGINSAHLLMEVLAGAQSKIGQEISKSGFSLQLSEQHQLIRHIPREQSESVVDQQTPVSNPAPGSKELPFPHAPKIAAKLFEQSNNSIGKAKSATPSSIKAKDLVLGKWKKAQELTITDPQALDKVLTELNLTPSVRASIKDALNEQGQISLFSLTRVLDRVAPSNSDLLPNGKAAADDIQSLLAGILQQQESIPPNLRELGIQLSESYNFGEFRELLRRLVDRSAKGSLAKPSIWPLHQTSEAISSCGKQSTDSSSTPRSRLPNQTRSLTTNLMPSFLKEEQEPAREAQKRTKPASTIVLSDTGTSNVSAPAGEEMGQMEMMGNDHGFNQINEQANRVKAEATPGHSALPISSGSGLPSRHQRSSSEGTQRTPSDLLSPGTSETQTPPMRAIPSSRTVENTFSQRVGANQNPSEMKIEKPLQSPSRVTANLAASGELVGRGLRLIPTEDGHNLRAELLAAKEPGKIAIPLVEKTAAPGSTASTSNQPNSPHGDSFRFHSTMASLHQFARLPSLGAATTSPGRDGQSPPWEQVQGIFRDVIRLQMVDSSPSGSTGPVLAQRVPEQGRPQLPPEGRSPEVAVFSSQGKTPLRAGAVQATPYQVNITNSGDVAELALPGAEVLPDSTFKNSPTTSGHGLNPAPAATRNPRSEAGVTSVEEGLWPSQLSKSTDGSRITVRESTARVMNDASSEVEAIPPDLTRERDDGSVPGRNRDAGNQQIHREAISPRNTKDMAARPDLPADVRKSSAARFVENVIGAASEQESKNPWQTSSEKPSVMTPGSGAEGNGSARAPLRQETRSIYAAELVLPGEKVLPGSTFKSSPTTSGQGINPAPAATRIPRSEAGAASVEEGSWPSEPLQSADGSRITVREGTAKLLNDAINELETIPSDLSGEQNGDNVPVRNRDAGNQQVRRDAISPEITKALAASPDAPKDASKSSAAKFVENVIGAASEQESKKSGQVSSERLSVMAPGSGAESTVSVRAPFRQDTSSIVEEGSRPSEPLKSGFQNTILEGAGTSKLLNGDINDFEAVPADLINDRNGNEVLIKNRPSDSQQPLEGDPSPEETNDASRPADAQKQAKPSSPGRASENRTWANSGLQNKNIGQTISEEPSIAAAPNGVENNGSLQAPFNQDPLAAWAGPDYQKSVEVLAGSETASKAAALKSAAFPKENTDQAVPANPFEANLTKAVSDKSMEKVTLGTHTTNQFARQEQSRDHDPNLFFQRDGIRMPTAAATSADQKGMEAFSSYTVSLPVELALRIRDLHSQKRSQLTLELEPEYLGRLLVRIDTDANQVKAFISTESAQVRELLTRSTAQLRQELASQGLVLEQLQIDVNSQATAHDQYFQKHDPGTRSSNWKRQPVVADEKVLESDLRKTQIGGADILISLFV